MSTASPIEPPFRTPTFEHKTREQGWRAKQTPSWLSQAPNTRFQPSNERDEEAVEMLKRTFERVPAVKKMWEAAFRKYGMIHDRDFLVIDSDIINILLEIFSSMTIHVRLDHVIKAMGIRFSKMETKTKDGQSFRIITVIDASLNIHFRPLREPRWLLDNFTRWRRLPEPDEETS